MASSNWQSWRRLRMELFKGEVVEYDGRSHTVLGIDPVGATPQFVYLQDLKTSESVSVPADEFVDRRVTEKLRLILGGIFDTRD
jgi:hypothetical protein